MSDAILCQLHSKTGPYGTGTAPQVRRGSVSGAVVLGQGINSILELGRPTAIKQTV